jgi:hypothetical protein
MNLERIEVYSAAVLALFFGVLIVCNTNVSTRAGRHVTFVSLSVQSSYGSEVAKRLLVPGVSAEAPEWLTKAQNDPNSALTAYGQTGSVR